MVALVPQPMSIDFSGGLDTKTDPQQLQAGKMQDLENARSDKNGRVSKRFGTQAVGNFTDNGWFTNIKSNGTQLVGFTDPATESSGMAMQYTQAAGGWVNQGPVCAVANQSTPIVGPGSSTTTLAGGGIVAQDHAAAGNVTLYAYSVRSSRLGNCSLYAYVVDNATGQKILSEVLLSSSLLFNSSAVKVVSFGSSIFVTYTTSGSSVFVYRYTIATNALTVVSPSSALTLFNSTYDVCAYDDGGSGQLLFALRSANSTITLSKMSIASSAVVSASFTLASVAGIAICIPQKQSSVFRVFTYDSSGGVRVTNFNTSMGLSLATTVVDSATSNFQQIGAIESADGSVAHLFYAAITTTQLLKYAKVATGGSVVSSSNNPTLALYSRPALMNGVPYVLTCYNTTLQPSYFLVSCATLAGVTKIFPAARSLYSQTSGSHPSQNSLTNLQAFSSTELRALGLQVVSGLDTQYPASALVSLRYSFDASNGYSDTQVGSSLWISGGFDLEFDGVSCYERNFLNYPEIFTATDAGAASGSLADGTYLVALLYEWYDSHGQLVQSAPGVIISVIINGDSNTGGISITETGPVLSMRIAPFTRNAIATIAYMSIAGGSTLFRVGDVTNGTGGAVTIGPSNAIIEAGALLPTTGGVQGNQMPDGQRAMTLSADRMVLADPGDNGLIHDGQPIADGFAAEMCAENTIRINAGGGAVTALAFMDDKIIGSKLRSMHICYGDGPNDLGQNSTRTDFKQQSYDTGAAHQDAGAIIPQGYIFMTPAKGIWLLGRDLSLAYIGAPVDAYKTKTVRMCRVNSDANEVRFLCTDGTILCYNYLDPTAAFWFVIPNSNAVDACILNGQWVFARAQAAGFQRVYQETSGIFTDAHQSPTGYGVKYVTGWISFAGKAGFQRLWRTQFRGNFASTHTIMVECAFDDETNNFIEEHVIDSADIVASGGSYRFEVQHYARQQCSSVCFRITELVPTGEGFSLTNMTIEAGMLPKLNRLRKEKRV